MLKITAIGNLTNDVELKVSETTRRLHGSSMPKRWSVWVWKNQHSKKKKERK